ncbi:hypothetical protein M758_6G126700 [Ceratodon purpureus]|nr:hypothetical protein M758_6G126700 [Ceratodon purpureus]
MLLSMPPSQLEWRNDRPTVLRNANTSHSKWRQLSFRLTSSRCLGSSVMCHFSFLITDDIIFSSSSRFRAKSRFSLFSAVSERLWWEDLFVWCVSRCDLELDHSSKACSQHFNCSS